MFREALDDCNLEDFGFLGDKLTWKRGNIKEQIDRALAMIPGTIILLMPF